MSYRVIVAIVSGLLACTLYAEETSGYLLGSGDVIKVSVYEEPELGLETKLGDSGVVRYPFLGNLPLMGLTVPEVERLITEGLRGDYLVDPIVNVSIMEYRQFFIQGEVEKPGGIPFSPGLTLRKAIALAGGFTERAAESKIYVSRDDESRKGRGRPIDLDEQIQPGDMITIEQSFF